MDAIQERFARRLLGLSKRCPRVILLHEFGWPLRQSTAARARAYTLLVRAHSDPRYDSARRVAVHAAQVRGSLANCILSFALCLGLGCFDLRCRRWGQLGKTARSSDIKSFARTKVMAMAQRYDRKWRSTAGMQAHLARHGVGNWTAADLAGCGCAIREVQSWARLRIQSAFTTQGLSSIPPHCALCTSAPETSWHLLVECDIASGILERAAMRSGLTLPSRGQTRLDYLLGSAPRIQMPFIPQCLRSLERRCEKARQVTADSDPVADSR